MNKIELSLNILLLHQKCRLNLLNNEINMEQKTVIIINNEKEFHPKGQTQTNDIKNFIKKIYNIPKESFIDLYDENYSKIIYSFNWKNSKKK